MVTTIKTWNSLINQSISGSTIGEQYQYGFFQFKEWMKTAGWTVLMSSNSLTSSNSDVLTSSTDIIWGSEGTQPTTYFVAESPNNWIISGNVQILAIADNPTVDTTPDEVEMRMSMDGYVLDATPLTDRPNPNGAETIFSERQLMPSNTFVNKHIHAWRTSDGDVIWGQSVSGSGVMESGLWFTALSGGENNTNFACYYRKRLPNFGSLNINNIIQSTHWESFFDASNPAPGEGYTLSEGTSLWTDGTTGGLNKVLKSSIDLFTNSATLARWIGRVEDVKAATANLLGGTVIDGDVDTVRLVVVDELWVPTSASQLPIIF